MFSPKYIQSTWQKFNTFPMETLTKIWVHKRREEQRQRSVSQMKEDYEAYGITGNCFDLAIWLLDEFKKDRIEAYPIGHDIGSEEAHVAVMALDEKGNRFLCDLGDQWLSPILLDVNENFSHAKHSGFFPAADIQVIPSKETVEIHYHRPNGKMSRQHYDLQPIELEDFMRAAEISQNNIYPKPLLECRIPYKNETAHWEFYNWKSYLSTTEGIKNDKDLTGKLEGWVERIHAKTGYHRDFLLETLTAYKELDN
ncbi:hypothetical protein [Sutcliffiella rhizosphaerae]|uniref:N-acetyltransferase n=1 Tax=Sutcliffiella rhizosphaerae TaxID=2880967 RepID=A0ABN8AI34_9BACI|nr:hypothetical protein [Sutcliffiella rhizosphaerae]CAG9622495.1 hypothetical protein BACCIP111883_03286 [Sutcliffiella rhizosphaerae]